MGKGIDIEDFDAFFNMRGRFWIENRERALTEKEHDKSVSHPSQDNGESDLGIGTEKRHVA